VSQRHNYGDDPSQYGVLYGEGPVAVLIHGGFWRDRYDLTLMDALAEDLASRGWAAWNIEYRRLGGVSGGGWPTTFGDVAAAIDHLAEIRTDFPLDLARVVAIGHSAGGHLATWAAARHRLPEGSPGGYPRVRVTAAVSQAGVVDLELAWDLRLSDGVVADFLGGTPEQHPIRYRIASPSRGEPLIAADVGGTHARVASIVPVSDDRGAAFSIGDYCKYACADYPSLGAIIETFRGQYAPVPAASVALAIAGYVVDDAVINVNLKDQTAQVLRTLTQRGTLVGGLADISRRSSRSIAASMPASSRR